MLRLITISNGKFIEKLVELNLSFLPVSELVVMKLLEKSAKYLIKFYFISNLILIIFKFQ